MIFLRGMSHARHSSRENERIVETWIYGWVPSCVHKNVLPGSFRFYRRLIYIATAKAILIVLYLALYILYLHRVSWIYRLFHPENTSDTQQSRLWHKTWLLLSLLFVARRFITWGQFLVALWGCETIYIMRHSLQFSQSRKQHFNRTTWLVWRSWTVTSSMSMSGIFV